MSCFNFISVGTSFGATQPGAVRLRCSDLPQDRTQPPWNRIRYPRRVRVSHSRFRHFAAAKTFVPTAIFRALLCAPAASALSMPHVHAHHAAPPPSSPSWPACRTWWDCIVCPLPRLGPYIQQPHSTILPSPSLSPSPSSSPSPSVIRNSLASFYLPLPLHPAIAASSDKNLFSR